jgi:hypothetical protein
MVYRSLSILESGAEGEMIEALFCEMCVTSFT